MKQKLLLLSLLAIISFPTMAQGVTKSYSDYLKYGQEGESYQEFQDRLDSHHRAAKIANAATFIDEISGGELYSKKAKSNTIKTYKIYQVVTPEAVDLGLPSGALWASFNLGAKKPEEVGNRYAWGETKPKSTFTSKNYKWRREWKEITSGGGKDADGFDLPIIKSQGWVNIGWTEGPGWNISETKYDAARTALGGDWRMPSSEDFKELSDNCKTESITKNNVPGLKFTGRNGNWIFIPYYNDVEYKGQLWTSEKFLGTDGNYHGKTCAGVGIGDLYLGCAIRPVKGGVTPLQKIEAAEKKLESVKKEAAEAAAKEEAAMLKEVETLKSDFVDLGTGVYWSTRNVDAKAEHETGSFVTVSDFEQFGKKLPYTKWTLMVPSEKQIGDLLEKCTWEQTTVNGVVGYKVTGKNGNSIFFPCGGNAKHKGFGETFYLWSNNNIDSYLHLLNSEDLEYYRKNRDRSIKYLKHKKGKASFEFGYSWDKFPVRLILVQKTTPNDYSFSRQILEGSGSPIYTVNDVDVKPKGYEYLAIYKEDVSYSYGQIDRVLRSEDIHGYGIAHFVVETDGSVSNIEVLSNTPEIIKNRIITKIYEMRGWKPGVRKGKKVPTRIILPIIY